ncbi:hypothetical protein NC652_000290 [Populus alba x Populus x berolinensis]|uniref:Uncharacterized protein n=1 Tax=Populus alba x Populus x berolinensis TaxID=444605 RepID=A0AAD6RIN3_9ROSI|nr:hypothetical protein NC652_000290 [Populus alba x Populus x berolinensis]KAJ7009573.1 hypothetical protein NC653_000307 [Populus alba x Populus x berolinensis]
MSGEREANLFWGRGFVEDKLVCGRNQRARERGLSGAGGRSLELRKEGGGDFSCN